MGTAVGLALAETFAPADEPRGCGELGFGEELALGDALLLGDTPALGNELALGDVLAPTGTRGSGVPLGRTRKTGPLGALLGEVVGSGTGVGVAAAVERGVGGKSEPGPAGTGGIGMSEGDAPGDGDAPGEGGTSPTPGFVDTSGTGGVTCATSAAALENTNEAGVLYTFGFGGGVWRATWLDVRVTGSVSMTKATWFGSYLAGGGSS